MGKAEKRVETLLCDGVKELGGKAYKFISPGRSGMPDRIVILPKGRIHFVELKSETGVLSKQQKRMLQKLRNMGHTALYITGRNGVLGYLAELKELMNR